MIVASQVLSSVIHKWLIRPTFHYLRRLKLLFLGMLAWQSWMCLLSREANGRRALQTGQWGSLRLSVQRTPKGR